MLTLGALALILLTIGFCFGYALRAHISRQRYEEARRRHANRLGHLWY